MSTNRYLFRTVITARHFLVVYPNLRNWLLTRFYLLNIRVEPRVLRGSTHSTCVRFDIPHPNGRHIHILRVYKFLVTISAKRNTVHGINGRGRYCSVGIATRYEVDGPGLEPSRRKRYSLLHKLVNRPRAPNSAIYSGYRDSISEVKADGAMCCPQIPNLVQRRLRTTLFISLLLPPVPSVAYYVAIFTFNFTFMY